MEQVILMCGLAGSGKSTVARRLERDGYVLLSFDEEAWRRGHRDHPVSPADASRVHEHLQGELIKMVASGARAVVDTSFWSRASRDDYRRLLAPLGVVPAVYHVVVPRDVLLSRLKTRSGAGPNDIVVSAESLQAYADGFQDPTPAEGPVRLVSGVSGAQMGSDV